MRWSTIDPIEVLIPHSLVRRWHRKLMEPAGGHEFEVLEVEARWPPACGRRPEPGMRVTVRMPDGYEAMTLETVEMHSSDIEVVLRSTRAL